MRVIEIPMKLVFNSDGGCGADIPDTKGIPKSLIVESLQNLSRGLSEQLVKEAQEDVKEEDVADYIDGMLNLDREKLKHLFK